jgi:hypothetical protein
MAEDQKPLAVTREDIAADGGSLIKQNYDRTSGTGVLRYPAELSDPEHPHYLMFFINVPENHLEFAGKRNLTYYDQTRENRLSDVGSTGNIIGGAAILTGATVGAAGVRAGLAAGGFGIIGRGASAIATGVTGALVGAGVGALVGTALAASVTTRRLVHLPLSIALQLNEKPSVAYQAEWADQDMGVLGAMALGGSQLSGWDRAALGIDAVGFGARDAAAAAISSPKGASIGGDIRSYIGRIEKRVRNPQKEQLFRGMNFREFSFEYVFMPKNKKEADEVLEIIKVFKKYMHPELSANKLFLTYPAEFNIIYYHRETENTYMNKIASCALRSMKVQYGGNDFTTFRDSEGLPTEIFMSLSFVELEALTKTRVEEGF